jgi:hypothetical protein
MSDKHTRSPLASEGNCLTAFDGKIGVAILEPEPAPRFWAGEAVPVIDGDEMEANARRLAAAWNACQGLSTVSLERAVVAALVDALYAAQRYIGADVEMEEAEGREGSACVVSDKICAALTLAKGE